MSVFITEVQWAEWGGGRTGEDHASACPGYIQGWAIDDMGGPRIS